MKIKTKKTTLGLGSFHQAHVEKLVYGGDGLCRVQGKVVFVPFCLEGEVIDFEIIREKRDVAFGVLHKVVSAVGRRIQARCKVFGLCGGCHLQHMTYDDQVNLKTEWVREALGVFSTPQTIWQEPHRATSPWEYRRRIRLHQSPRGGWGFYRRREHHVVEIDQCPISHPAFFESADFLKNQKTEVDLIYDAKQRRVLFGSAKDQTIVETLQGFQVEVDAGDFLQVNEEENQHLVAYVQNLARKSQAGVLWDLFSGSGNFTIPLASAFKNVLSIESNHNAIARLKQNALKNGLTNVTAHARAIDAKGISEFLTQGSPNLVVVDPPRGGARQVMEAFVRENYSGDMIYVSCDLPSLKRDVALLHAAGWRISEIKWFDLFPQTFHLETVIFLSR